jgi:hypothetical protein
VRRGRATAPRATAAAAQLGRSKGGRGTIWSVRHRHGDGEPWLAAQFQTRRQSCIMTHSRHRCNGSSARDVDAAVAEVRRWRC